MKRIVAFVVILLAPGFLAPASAQVSATTGAINGKVTDATGGVLPGVTVTVASPNMQGTRSDVTSQDGEYRFPAVPPGEYRITYELTGFGTLCAKASRRLAYPRSYRNALAILRNRHRVWRISCR